MISGTIIRDESGFFKKDLAVFLKHHKHLIPNKASLAMAIATIDMVYGWRGQLPRFQIVPFLHFHDIT